MGFKKMGHLHFYRLIFLTSIFFIRYVPAAAQDTNPMYMTYDMYQYDYKMINPAFAGLLNGHSIGINYKVLQTKLPNNFSSFIFSYEGRADNINSGFGAFIGTQRNYFLRGDNTRINLLYNYQLSLNNGGSLNIGAGYNFYRAQIDFDALSLAHAIQFDGIYIDPKLSLLMENSNFKSHDMDFGIVYSHQNLVIGLSGVNIFKSRRSEFFQDRNSKTWDLFTSYKFPLSNKIDFVPSGLLYTNFNFWNGDLNTQFIFDDTFILGISHRIIHYFDNYWNFSAGFNIADRLQIFGLFHSTIYRQYPKDSGPSFEFIITGKIVKDNPKKIGSGN